VGEGLPQSKTDEYLGRILLGLIREVKGKNRFNGAGAATKDGKEPV